MLRKSVFFIVLAVGIGLASQAWADDQPDTEFYDFENMLIDGEFVSPDLEHMQAQGEAQFDRLLNLQTSFIPKVEQSTQEPSFR